MLGPPTYYITINILPSFPLLNVDGSNEDRARRARRENTERGHGAEKQGRKQDMAGIV